MGCGNVREDLEDQIMLIRLQRMKIQMEREKSFKQLSELEGHTINMDNISNYLANSGKIKLIKKIKLEQNDKKENDKDEDKNDNNKNQHDNKPQCVQRDSSQLLIEEELQKNKNNNLYKNDNIDQNIIDVNTIPSLNINVPKRKLSKKKKATKRKTSRSLYAEKNIININNNDIQNNIINSGENKPIN